MRRFVTLAFALMVPLATMAQGIQLTAEQQRMLDQLPPAQKQQALNAIRQMQAGQSSLPAQTLNEPVAETAAPAGAADIDALLASLEITAQARSRVVINFAPRGSLSSAESRILNTDPALQQLLGSHLFVLDDNGVLSLQGLEQIPLLGLSESDINRRLQAEPNLSLFAIDASILGQDPIGAEALEPFGYDVFVPDGPGLAAPSSGPVPSDYVLGPGDSIRVQLFGNVNGIYEYEVTRDGILNLPEIGPVTVAGIPFSEFRDDLDHRVQQMLIGTQVSVTMGQLRTIRVFVLGDVNRPGSYVVSGLETMTGALYQSGGISPVGSLRSIQLKRNGELVSTLDAYDMLIRGDTTGDRRLQPGDVIFVPPVGKTVAISGAVNRPAIYEVKRLTTAADMVKLAGGLTAEAFAKGARIERVSESDERTVLAVDLSSDSANEVRVLKGDTLLVPEVLPEFGNAVTLAGHVHRPGSYPWRPGMKLSDLLPTRQALMQGVDMEYLLIRRETERGGSIEAVSANLARALAEPGSTDDLTLEAGDTVNVFALSLGRSRVVNPLLDELDSQSTVDAPARRVQVSGSVRVPGVYPLEDGMRISDLLRAGGNLSEDAFALEAELTRYSVSPSGSRTSENQKVDLFAVRNGDSVADLELQEHDYLIVNRVPEWNAVWTVRLEGEVMFPGEYRVQRGETLDAVVRRAGGLTDSAFAAGAVFLRESLRESEQEQIELLARRMEADLTQLSLQNSQAGSGDSLATGQELLAQLRNAEAVGRLVIDVSHIYGTGEKVELRDGDELLIPSRTQVVSVIGETQQNTSHLFEAGLSRDDYIALSGGLTRRADKRQIYIVRANGAVLAPSGSRFLGRRKSVEIQPGDTIVVPLDADKMRPLTFWTNVTQILYQSAIAVAAIRSFNN